MAFTYWNWNTVTAVLSLPLRLSLQPFLTFPWTFCVSDNFVWPAILYLSTRCPQTVSPILLTWLPHPLAHLVTFLNHAHLLKHLPLIISSVFARLSWCQCCHQWLWLLSCYLFLCFDLLQSCYLRFVWLFGLPSCCQLVSLFLTIAFSKFPCILPSFCLCVCLHLAPQSHRLVHTRDRHRIGSEGNLLLVCTHTLSSHPTHSCLQSKFVIFPRMPFYNPRRTSLRVLCVHTVQSLIAKWGFNNQENIKLLPLTQNTQTCPR